MNMKAIVTMTKVAARVRKAIQPMPTASRADSRPATGTSTNGA